MKGKKQLCKLCYKPYRYKVILPNLLKEQLCSNRECEGFKSEFDEVEE